jgi:hypothetical protein
MVGRMGGKDGWKGVRLGMGHRITPFSLSCSELIMGLHKKKRKKKKRKIPVTLNKLKYRERGGVRTGQFPAY